MITIDLSNISEILIDGIFDRELDSNLRKKVLDDAPKEHYEMACQIFHATRKEYFELGLKIGLKVWADVK